MNLPRDLSLDEYLGSQHSAVGLVLAWFAVPAIGCGIFGLGAPDEIPRWISISLTLWGAIALPLGLSMRRRRPSWPAWLVANALLGGGWMVLIGFLFLGR